MWQIYPTALADGGVMQLHRSSGPFVITVFTAPAPLRAGTVDISVMVQDSRSQSPLLDANIVVSLYNEDGKAIKAEARRDLSRNKLFYSAIVILPEAGRWTIEVTVRRNSEETRIDGAMTVAARESVLLANWWALALPPAMIVLFMLNQWLKSRMNSKRH
ncbi:MAG: hypothetical protein J2P31_07065 [Blastocatellia bacterium]|nr:hypothetical protein [Blastocatellia bacterium]